MPYRPSTLPLGARTLSADEVAALERDMADIVARSHLFKSLDDAARKELLESAFVMQYDAGEMLLREGDPGDTMFLVMEGTVRVHTHSAQGEIQLAELGRGACVGEVSVLTGSPRTATVDAMTAVTCAVLARHRVQRILDAHPRVRALLEALVEGRAKQTLERILGS
ncbi:MAG: cyclic nucleotide-binding domain-containing protein [Sandaracinaceae bacterium]|nr:cyclic nucleotide-binding domain-containing protein [Sandaracinaceae bacterium]